MNKRFNSKKSTNKKIKVKLFLLIFSQIISIFLTIKVLAKYNLPKENKDLVKFLINNNSFIIDNKSNYSYFHNIMTKLINIDITKPVDILNTNFQGLTTKDDLTLKNKVNNTSNVSNVDNKEYLIYLYNTHDKEEYKPSSFAEYSVIPTVKLINYVLKEEIAKDGYNVLIEKNDIKTIRNKLGLNYAGSYKASRVLMSEAKEKNPSLKYFIDIHRDSLEYSKTTLTYNNKNYAKLMFIVGLENPNYKDNLEFSNKISTALNEKIPSISKGVYKKSGPTVNGIYNQDFSKRTILIEVGGKDNTIDEVYESLLILSDVLIKVIKDDKD